ncbi:hypothetical protein PMG11_10095 [Penicillium brasilianum]|uniref:Uncharacterized protein n=1 Tax=Penicillium brasilianum TaxID=104259 RepID=A0A0F7U1R3_PENBI|nr:hypothetical protein PMG11_10095 [Penicillium brasilianum]
MAQRVLLLSALLGLTCGSLAAYLPRRDKTITIPDGVTYHPESQDICTSTAWTDVASFFLGNYVSHVATVVRVPGEPLYITAANMFFVLLFPCLGAGRGINMIYQRASFYKDQLQQALRAQALVMVVRDLEWEPQPGDTLRSLSLYPPRGVQTRYAPLGLGEYWRAAVSKSWIKTHVEKVKGYTGYFESEIAHPPWLIMNYGLASKHVWVERGYHVSGVCDLPEGYRLAYVPPNAMVEHILPEVELGRILQSSYSLASTVISIVQILSACSALYQSKGYQITAYGYAAFGFTVTPYLVMSFVNLLANCFTPTYPNVYLVHTEIMEEAVSRGGRFTYIVGKLESEPLVVEDLTLFSATFKQHDEEDGEIICRIGDKVLEDGSIEPIPDGTSTHESASEDSVHGNASTLPAPTELPEKTPPPVEEIPKQEVQPKQDCSSERSSCENFEPVLIIPSCYNFKLSYSNTSSTSILHRKKHYGPRGYMTGGLTVLVAALPLIAIGVMSKFQPGGSTVAQRAWLMAWYAVGIVSVQNPYFTDEMIEFGYYGTRLIIETRKDYSRLVQARYFFLRLASLLPVVLPIAPAIGGFVVVGQMLVSYGSCTEL